MPDDKKVRISIETEADTSGAKEAEKALEKVTSTGDKIREALGDDVADQFQDIEDSIRNLRNEADELTEDSLEHLNDATSEIANRQKLEAVERLTDKIGGLGGRIEKAGREMEDAGDQGGAAFRKLGQGLQTVSNQVGTVAAGLAAGGPIGGAVAALTVLVEALFDAWAAGAIRVAKLEQLLKEEADETAAAARRSAEAFAEREAVLSSDQARLALDRELESLKAQTDQFSKQVALARTLRALEEKATTAEDRAALAEIDAREEAGEISRADAAKERAKIESAAKERQKRDQVRAALDQARTARSELTEAVGRRDRLEKELPESRGKLDDATGRLGGFTNALENGRDRLRDLQRREIGGEDVSAERERLDRAIENVKSELREARVRVEVARKDVAEVEKKLDRAKDDVARERSEFAAAVKIADKTISTTKRVSKAGEREASVNAARRSRSERAPVDGNAEAASIREVADSLSGVGNASRNAKAHLIQALDRVQRDGQVLEAEIPQLVAAVNRALEWLPAREARLEALLKSAVDAMNHKLSTVERQLRNGRTGQ